MTKMIAILSALGIAAAFAAPEAGSATVQPSAETAGTVEQGSADAASEKGKKEHHDKKEEKKEEKK